MAIDNADWHSGGDYPSDLPLENGGTHIGMFLAWAIINDLQGESHDEEAADELAEVRAREMTGREFLFQACDGKFCEEDLSAEGNEFAAAYYSGESGQVYGAYIADYAGALNDGLPSLYHVADTWANFDTIAVIISRRFTEWRAARA